MSVSFLPNIVQPRSLKLEASSFCQLRCPSCPTTSRAIHPVVGSGFLRLENFRKLVDDNPWVEDIELSNYGEIFLNPHLVSILQYAYRRGVKVSAANGVNLNTARPEALEAVVKFEVQLMSCSIDGASPETYRVYRVRGDFDTVIANIRTINAHKLAYGTELPRLRWQFVVFGHNQHELPLARQMADELGMEFWPKLTWDDSFSPLRDPEFVSQQVGIGASTRQDYEEQNGKDYMAAICHQLWDSPQVNWDGKMLGCCRNYWGDFGGNAFRDGLLATINGDKMRYARDMLLGRRPAREDIPCTTCEIYLGMRRRGRWLQRASPIAPKSSIDRLKARLRGISLGMRQSRLGRWLLTLRQKARLILTWELMPGIMSRAIVIKMENINNSGMPVQFIGQRSRLSSCTSVKLVDKERLVACNLAGQRMYLIRYDLDSGRHEIEDCIPTRFGDKDVRTDLMDGDNRGRFATSNCEDGSVSIYRLNGNRLEFEKDLPIPDEKPGFCHGVRFVPPEGDIICATTTMEETSVYFLHVGSGEVIYKFRDDGWRPKDVCFLDDSRMFVIYACGMPSYVEAPPYDSKLSLIAFELGTGRHEVISELMINGHVDCCRHLGARLYITNSSRDCVMIVRFEDNRLTLDHEILGYNFPHGIDVLPSVMAVTNYGTNSIVLSIMDEQHQ